MKLWRGRQSVPCVLGLHKTRGNWRSTRKAKRLSERSPGLWSARPVLWGRRHDS